ncbi:MAG: ATP-dependent zinc metalloprotease FtsH [Anaeromusa sp.]|uniref:ATP-dependent zinc metalloprotease FtsH n=1 Tax=Anaeromusa sp. TaxID=1872520 RepID=UPI002B206027|nr:ATP-dependent zinc metalloprotease FtsH [Anaeromusa sp.]MEA4834532.1 ATP-dependent zinc metalloprotease FtsH [Anaeromusa sp.]
MEEKKEPKKTVFYYYAVTLLIMLVLNLLIFPMFFRPQVTLVDYGAFLTQIKSGAVTLVEIQDNQINFVAKDGAGKEVSYVTGRIADPELVNRLYNAGVVFSQDIPKEKSPLVNLIFTWILPLIIFVVVGQFVAGQLQKRMGGGISAMTFGKSNAKIYAQSETGKSFADVAGQDEAKEALVEIIDFLHNPGKYAEIGASLPKGALLVGPPGTGKTLLAQAVAGEANVPFFSISGSEFVEMFVGMGAAKVRDMFKQANEKAPCIIFIDEIDTIGKRRDSRGFNSNDEREQTLDQLLTEMDGFDGKKGVVILAATNRPEILDKALLRPGRFDRRIPVELPDLAGREAILLVHARKVKMEPDINFNEVARATSGASGAELANIINESALRAVKYGRKLVSQNDLEESVEVIIAGYQRRSAVIPPKEKEIIAYHEIGHALVAAKQSESAQVHKITIIPRTSGTLGYTMQIEEGEHVLISKEEAFNKIATCTGGRAAEEIAFGTFTSGAANDIKQATSIARAMVTRFGMSKNFDMMALESVENQYLSGDSLLACSSETASKVDIEVLEIIKQAHDKATSILNENVDKLHALARYLLEKETITGEEFLNKLKENSPSV